MDAEAGHTPQSLSVAFAMHRQFETGDMRGVDWAEWRNR